MSRLLSHYWTANDPPAARQAQIEDWLDDLGEFEVGVVEEACRRWRRQPGGRRPTPGDIRAYCIEEMRDATRAALPPPDKEAVARRAAELDQMARDGREISDTWARARGHADFDAYLASGGSYAQAIASMAVAQAPEVPPPRGDRRRAIKELGDFSLPDADAPGVRQWLRKMGEEA